MVLLWLGVLCGLGALGSLSTEVLGLLLTKAIALLSGASVAGMLRTEALIGVAGVTGTGRVISGSRALGAAVGGAVVGAGAVSSQSRGGVLRRAIRFGGRYSRAGLRGSRLLGG